jgi:RND family efflux transporter MFP subunit
MYLKKMKMKRRLIYVSLSVILAACGSSNTNEDIVVLQHRKDSLKIVYADVAAQIAAIDEQLIVLDTTIKLPLITVGTIEEKAFEHYVEIQGAVEVGGNALVYPEVQGKVIAIRFREGNKVRKGDLIIQLDASTLTSTIKEVKTSYNLAKDMFEKQDRLWKEKIGSEVQYLQIKANKESLEQKLKTLKEQLDMYSIRAPFSGVIDEINPKVGEAVNPALPALRVINFNDTYLKADVSENYVKTIKVGNVAKVFFPALDKEFITQINQVGNYINPNNRTFNINIDLSEFKENVKPNLLADIKVLDYKADSAVVVASRIVQQDRQGNEYIYVAVKDGAKTKAKKVIITTGLSYEKYTLVLTGLKGGEKYIDKGARSIQDGELVEIVED